MSRNELVDLGTFVGVVGGLLFGFLSMTRSFGSRGEEGIYSFLYNNKPAQVVRVDKRWAPDEYYLKIDGKDVIREGKIVADDGKEIIIETYDRFLPKYSIRDTSNQ